MMAVTVVMPMVFVVRVYANRNRRGWNERGGAEHEGES